ncbi:MAG TPA: universal stress protein [Candidatus Dormibacteraeota bacterium]|nr:universal stress protein [Candidatus Dormibacteraeota bacterium]
MQSERIVVGLDGSPDGDAALRWAARLAAASGGEVVVVHAVEPPPDDVRPLNLPRAILNEENWCEALTAEVEGAWCARLSEAGVRHRVRVVVGRAGPRLVEIAAEEHADLIVAGRGGQAELADVVHGGVASYLTHHAPCPVAVVPNERQAA